MCEMPDKIIADLLRHIAKKHPNTLLSEFVKACDEISSKYTFKKRKKIKSAE